MRIVLLGPQRRPTLEGVVRSLGLSGPGLAGPVDIGFDADGIPRIRAANAIDAAAALGFVHARDRLFQLELMRRAASGRLSEIAGTAVLERGVNVSVVRLPQVHNTVKQGLITYAVLGLLTDGGVRFLERHLLSWQAER